MNDRRDERPDEVESPDEDLQAFNRRFKYALVACALVEFMAIALVVYEKTMR